MNIKLLFITIIFFFITMAPICSATEPIWDIDFFINEDKIIKEKPFEIKVFIMGEGKITDNRIKICTDKNIVFIDDSEAKFSGCIYKKINKGFNEKIEIGNFTIPLVEIGEINKEVDEIKNGFEWHLSKPPIVIKAKTTIPGDQRLSATMLYADENGQYFVNKKEINVHTTSWYERNQWWVIPLTVFVSILSLIFSGAYSIEIKKWISQLIFKIKNLKIVKRKKPAQEIEN